MQEHESQLGNQTEEGGKIREQGDCLRYNMDGNLDAENNCEMELLIKGKKKDAAESTNEKT